jgi:hypothetical protein
VLGDFVKGIELRGGFVESVLKCILILLEVYSRAWIFCKKFIEVGGDFVESVSKCVVIL